MQKQRLVVIGNGMAGARVVEEILARGGGEMFDIVMFGDEPYGNYNRILLSNVMNGSQHPSEIFLNAIPWYRANGIRLHAGVRVMHIDRARKKVYGLKSVVEPYDKLIGKLGRPIVPADIPGQQRINPSDEWWQQWFSDNGVPADEAALRRPGIRLENQANEGHAAMGGLGFAVLTPLLWKGDVAAGRLVAPFPDRFSARGWAYWLVYPKESRMVTKVKRFREWLIEEMARAVGDLDGGWSRLNPHLARAPA